MAGENVPSRPIAKNGTLYLLPVTSQVSASVFTPTAAATLAAGANIFGPATDIGIRDTIQEINQTAGGDQGHMVVFGRKEMWEITVAAFMDVSTSPKAVGGDSRLQILIGKYVEFLVLRDTGIYVCQGVGRFNLDTYQMPVQASDTIVRNIRVSRWLPGTVGDVQWARGSDGTFAVESATVP